MKYEPALERPALIEALRQHYGLRVCQLTFFPEGTVGCHYIAECEDATRQFVTLLGSAGMAQLQARRLDFNLRLQAHLHASGAFTCLPAVRRTLAGALQAEFSGMPLIVYQYIPGESLAGKPYERPLMEALGELSARLHNATAVLGFEVPHVERFELPFEAQLQECLQDLARGSAAFTPEQAALRDLILPQELLLRQMLERLHAVRAQVRALGAEFVLVHTDLTPWNLIRTPEGALFVVDWEGTQLAPAEADLFIFPRRHFRYLLRAYRRAAPARRLHAELFTYYHMRRTLEDITYFILPILREHRSAEENQNDLQILAEDCLTDLPLLERYPAWVRSELRAGGAA